MRIHNTLTGHVEEFKPQREGQVAMYNCGPTVYKRQHIGNYRAFLMADLLRRALTYLGYEVTQIMNITDVGHLTEDDVADAQGEDKLQKEAARRNVDPWEIAREQERYFMEDLAVLRVPPAHGYPRATDHVAEMIEMIGQLIEKGHAYEVDGNVYFSIDSFPAYGRLSGNTMDKLNAGAGGRVEERTDKKSPHDFALWKRDEKHLMQWDSPWGKGYPGWHIECSAMAKKYLGETLDIHTGGPDNKFPHHECEIAQTESITGRPFVRYWVHCGWLEIGGGKMSKSKGELYTIPELTEMGYEGADIRLFLLRSHYRAPLPFDLELLDEAKTVRARLDNFVYHEMTERPDGTANPDLPKLLADTRRRFKEALEDDLNTSAALAALFELMHAVNKAQPGREDAERVVALVREFDEVFDVLSPPPQQDLDAEIQSLIEERDTARAERNFARADEIRDELAARGIELIDTDGGTRWKKS